MDSADLIMLDLRERLIGVGRRFESASRGALMIAIGAYRTLGTTFLGGSCRFEPSCSAYAVEACQTHAIGRAVFLIGRRLLRCRPGGPCGYDPVPPG